MRSHLFALVTVVAGLAALAVGAPAGAGPTGSDEATACVFTTQLRAENEVPTSNSNAFGYSQIKIRNDGTIEYKTLIVNPENETFFAGHIHLAPVGSPGPIVQSLFFPGPNDDREIMDSGEVSNPALAEAICANPSAYYVNYHTTAHPTGAVRGQLG
jgi:CHRD domain